ncbi:hypothetical protein [Phaffia rhodozyma]|uniref:Uncharacterized protein n=1 Tax=Phaffia rhodozyma TaxID=264483 RepID=A0A0F7STX2_PHARH|nr:hypothetical protein [Phaffia rhodozyma]
MPTAADIRLKNEKFAAKVGQRQPAKKSTTERRAKEAATSNAKWTKIVALGFVALLAGGLALEIPLRRRTHLGQFFHHLSMYFSSSTKCLDLTSNLENQYLKASLIITYSYSCLEGGKTSRESISRY